jgi:hypothetical protein
MRHYLRRRRGDDFITAAELACFAYCPEQWRLEYGLELAVDPMIREVIIHNALCEPECTRSGQGVACVRA